MSGKAKSAKKVAAAKRVLHIVRLSAEERSGLQQMVDQGKRAGSVLKKAWILLKADQAEGAPAWSDRDIVQAYGISLSTVHRTREAFVHEGLDAALFRKKPTGRQYRMLDGAQEAKLVAIACSQPPKGCVRWTLSLLADRMVELKIVESISRDTVRRTLQKTNCSRTARSAG
jgi:transposase